MTLLCVGARVLPGLSPCTVTGEHDWTCPDPDTCSGCLPRPASRGFLCAPHYDRVLTATSAWSVWLRRVNESGGRLVSSEGGSSTPEGFTNLPLTFLAVDECLRHLASKGARTVDLWVHDEAGARDALLFTVSAERAYRSLQVEARPVKIRRDVCENCERVTVRGHLTREVAGHTVVTCEWCGHQLGKVRTGPPRWAGSGACEGEGHADCTNRECVCECHDLGRRSTREGITALWDADQHTAGYVDRKEWFAYGTTIRHEPAERRRTA